MKNNNKMPKKYIKALSINQKHKVALQLYWNHTSAWVFSCKFAAYFQNTFY